MAAISNVTTVTDFRYLHTGKVLHVPVNLKIKDLKEIVQDAFNLQTTPVENIQLFFGDYYYSGKKYSRRPVDDMEIGKFETCTGKPGLHEYHVLVLVKRD